jgi:hypothetical protein
LFFQQQQKTRIFTKNAAHINSYHTKKYVVFWYDNMSSIFGENSSFLLLLKKQEF